MVGEFRWGGIFTQLVMTTGDTENINNTIRVWVIYTWSWPLSSPQPFCHLGGGGGGGGGGLYAYVYGYACRTRFTGRIYTQAGGSGQASNRGYVCGPREIRAVLTHTYSLKNTSRHFGHSWRTGMNSLNRSFSITFLSILNNDGLIKIFKYYSV